MERILTQQEMWDFDEYHYRKDLATAELSILKEKAKAYELRKKICELEAREISRCISDKNGEIVKIKDDHRKRNDILCERLDIPSRKFEFDPDTGEATPFE